MSVWGIMGLSSPFFRKLGSYVLGRATHCVLWQQGMADFLMVCVGGRTAFWPLILQEQSKDLSKTSTCSCGSVCSEGRDWMSSCVPGIWRHRTCTISLCFGVLSNLSLAGEGIYLTTYLWGFFIHLFVWIFFSLISKLCYLSSQRGCSSILSFESREMKQTMII